MRESSSRPARSPVLASVSVPLTWAPGRSRSAAKIAAPSREFDSASAPLAAAARSMCGGSSAANAPLASSARPSSAATVSAIRSARRISPRVVPLKTLTGTM